MANTDKQNFRCDKDVWQQFKRKLAEVSGGYEYPSKNRPAGDREVTMTSVLRDEVERVINETPQQTARRLKLVAKEQA